MTSQPKRPSSPSNPSARPSTIPVPQRPSTLPAVQRPSTVRDAVTEAHALGGGAVGRPSAAVKSTGRKTILLVDPDAALRARLRALLEPYYNVMEAADGLEAMDRCSQNPPSMIVSDTALPRLDGFSLAKMMRSNPIMKRVPIMFVSAQDSPQHVTQALVIGVSQYVPKTTPLSQIVEKIRKIAL